MEEYAAEIILEEYMEKQIKLTLDDTVLDEYEKYYFVQHPRARKKPIVKPRHPSINEWFILQRPQMNALKQKWKDFVVWWMDHEHLSNQLFPAVSMRFITYMPTRRRVDPDNTVPKFILDGMVESKVILDDDSLHLKELILCAGYDKEHPRTEIIITVLEE